MTGSAHRTKVRGTQYASTDYTDLLKDHGITISMSRKGHPWAWALRLKEARRQGT